MKNKKLAYIFPLLTIALGFVVAIYFYPYMPDQMATHWGIDNQPNGYSSKNFGLFFMPVLSLILFFVFLLLPKTDPYKKNFYEFENYYQNFISLTFFFLFYLFIVTINWNLGSRFNMIQILSPGFAALFYYAGVLTSHAKRNWFVGIRTPWTMHNDQVWDKTHKLGGKLFKITGLVTLLSLFLPDLAFYFIFFPIIISTITVFVYSYTEYKKTVI